MALQWYTACKVNQAGAAADGTELLEHEPVIYINLTDEDGSFANLWFYAQENAQKEMLLVALHAMSMNATVAVYSEPPDPAGPYRPIHRLYTNAHDVKFVVPKIPKTPKA